MRAVCSTTNAALRAECLALELLSPTQLSPVHERRRRLRRPFGIRPSLGPQQESGSRAMHHKPRPVQRVRCVVPRAPDPQVMNLYPARPKPEQGGVAGVEACVPTGCFSRLGQRLRSFPSRPGQSCLLSASPTAPHVPPRPRVGDGKPLAPNDPDRPLISVAEPAPSPDPQRARSLISPVQGAAAVSISISVIHRVRPLRVASRDHADSRSGGLAKQPSELVSHRPLDHSDASNHKDAIDELTSVSGSPTRSTGGASTRTMS